MFHLFTCCRNAGGCVCFTCLHVVVMQVLCVFHLFTCRINADGCVCFTCLPVVMQVVVCVSPVYLSS